MGNECQPSLTIAEQRRHRTVQGSGQPAAPGSGRSPSGPPELKKSFNRRPAGSGDPVGGRKGPSKDGYKITGNNMVEQEAAVFSRNSMVEQVRPAAATIYDV